MKKEIEETFGDSIDANDDVVATLFLFIFFLHIFVHISFCAVTEGFFPLSSFIQFLCDVCDAVPRVFMSDGNETEPEQKSELAKNDEKRRKRENCRAC